MTTAPPIGFAGQVAIVTGAGSGIGREIALMLAARGARVVVNDCGSADDGAPLALAVVDEIMRLGGVALAETTAVGGHEAARAIASAALANFDRIDILVNNAGIARPGPFGEGADADIDHVLAVNLTGPFALMRAVWPTMRGQAYGRILNMSSSAALGSGISGPYAASKAGLIGLTKDSAIAGEAFGIKVNALMPQAYTRLIDKHPDPSYRAWMARNLPPEKVASVAAFLASRDVPVSGEVFGTGGGRIARIGFIESAGYLDPSLTPEGLSENFGRVCDLSGGHILTRQADMQKIYHALFP